MTTPFKKTINNYDCVGPAYPPNTLFYHPQTGQPLKSNKIICPINYTINPSKPFDFCKSADPNFSDLEHLPVNINNKTFLSNLYNISSLYDADNYLKSNNSNYNYITKSRIINSIYKVFKTENEFPSDTFCFSIKDILLKYHNIDIPLSKIKQKIIDNKNNKNWANLFDFFIVNYK
jgi:hypothetical protein